MTVADSPGLGVDTTIHICVHGICSTSAHDELPAGANYMPPDAIGWVTDDKNEDRKVYALKDCWVDERNLDNEAKILKAVEGVSNVVRLVGHWDVQYDGCSDSTSKIRDHLRESLTSFTSVAELVKVFLALVVAHKTMVTERNVLHGDISPNNIDIHEGKGYLLDFDHAKFVENSRVATLPCISWCLLKLMRDNPTPELIDRKTSDDLESLFCIFLEFVAKYGGSGGSLTDEGQPSVNTRRWNDGLATLDDRIGIYTSGLLKEDFQQTSPTYEPAPYFKVCRPFLEEWRKAIRDAMRNGRDVSHHQNFQIIKLGLNNIENFPISPPASSSPPSVVSSKLPPPASPAVVQDPALRPRRSG
ncbi:uncharacterized protein EDB91DRAFT_1079130 [Suillus paluster]|uniref:uncharacterized protein n=1 Tax=Suillus paluster TaxID=48578 RepID=UPI001B869CE4|nr:uncharacterized protein EDB91DRAFT_1079130 [Suillus paluster]KAG1749026.1 hypothetical protein EDB91DRAFT_1079130 [Suillus paluster]